MAAGSLIDLVRVMAPITDQSQIKRRVGTGELFGAKADVGTTPANAIVGFEFPFTVIQSLCRDEFRRVCTLQGSIERLASPV